MQSSSSMLSLKRKQKKLRQKQRRQAAAAGGGGAEQDDAGDAGSSDSDDGATSSTAGTAHAAALLKLDVRASRLNALGFDEGELGFSADDLAAAIRVVTALGADLIAFRSQPFKGLRGAMHPIVEEQLKNYGLKGNAKRKRSEKDVAELASLKEQDKEWVNRAALRAKRLAQLEELNKASGPALANGNGPLLLTHMGEVEEAVASIKMHRVADGAVELAQAEEEEVKQGVEGRRLNFPINCYTCKRPFRDLHFFYDQLCPACASLNYQKRNEVADLTGRVALVTGARVKIGYRIALKLLRCGATVIATSRFAADCARRYTAEKDFDRWNDRLHCFGLDFRNLAELEHFCAHLKTTFMRLDIIINNACQTIRRPAQYYEHLLVKERCPQDEREPAVRALLENNEAFSSAQHRGDASLITGEPGADSINLKPCKGTSAEGVRVRVLGEREGEEEEEEEVEAVFDESKYAGGQAHRAHADLAHAGGTCTASQSAGERQHAACAADGIGSSARAAPARVSRPAAGGGGTIAGDMQRGLVGGHAGSCKGSGGGAAGGRSGGAAEMSQLVVLEEDLARDKAAFPVGASGQAVVDVNEQQLDLRRKNSWMLKLNEVSTGELAEVMAINAIAPAVINARLKPLMEASPEKMRFIVNVSAMEGKFYRYKSDQHPHTNMAKAALNMMTRTSAQDYVKTGIYMTAVDTGWINDEKPMEIAARHGERHNFQTPIDEIDAAARVLDPVIAPVLAAQEGKAVEPPSGVFLKDFVKCEW